MSVRSRRLWGPTKYTNTNYNLVYTVPADRTLILRTATFYNASGADTPFILAVNTGDIDHVVWREVICSARTASRLDQGTAVNAMPRELANQELILNPGDTLYVQGSAQPYVSSGFGSLLLGAPS